MTRGFRKSFALDLKKIKHRQLLQHVKEIVEQVEQAPNIGKMDHLKQR